MRIAFVVQRYGREVNGGAELHCRLLAERVAARDDVSQVTVFTTCAKDYQTWANYYPAGVEALAGVRVERFETEFERFGWAQEVLGAALRIKPHPHLLESAWLRAQGPVTPKLLARLDEVTEEFDVFVFFTYLYYPTVLGLRRAPGRRILVPTAHDEAAIYLDLFREVFEAPEALAFNCEEERDFALGQFAIAAERVAIVGCGVDIPERRARAGSARARPYLLYLGRLARNKGVPELVRAFSTFKERHAERRFEAHSGSFHGRELELVITSASTRDRNPASANASWRRSAMMNHTCSTLRELSPRHSSPKRFLFSPTNAT
jgi:glycosyltransferase involved in cell wall biosynthesis